MTYSEKLKDPRWQKKRLKILERDEWACVMCRCEEKTLHVHHERYCGEPWDCPDGNLKTVCEQCHKIIEVLKSVYNSARPLKVYRLPSVNTQICYAELIDTETHKLGIILFEFYEGELGHYIVLNQNCTHKLAEIIQTHPALKPKP